MRLACLCRVLSIYLEPGSVCPTRWSLLRVCTLGSVVQMGRWPMARHLSITTVSLVPKPEGESAKALLCCVHRRPPYCPMAPTMAAPWSSPRGSSCCCRRCSRSCGMKDTECSSSPRWATLEPAHTHRGASLPLGSRPLSPCMTHLGTKLMETGSGCYRDQHIPHLISLYLSLWPVCPGWYDSLLSSVQCLSAPVGWFVKVLS